MKASSLFKSLSNTHCGCYHAREREAVIFTPLLPIYTWVEWGSGISVLPKNTPRLRWPDSNPQPLDHKSNALTTELWRMPRYAELRYTGINIQKQSVGQTIFTLIFLMSPFASLMKRNVH